MSSDTKLRPPIGTVSLHHLQFSRLAIFPKKHPNPTLFQGHMTKHEIFPSDMFFPLVIPKFGLFRSSADRFWDKHFSAKTAESALFQKSHDKKWNYFVRYIFFLGDSYGSWVILMVYEISTFTKKKNEFLTSNSFVFVGWSLLDWCQKIQLGKNLCLLGRFGQSCRPTCLLAVKTQLSKNLVY